MCRSLLVSTKNLMTAAKEPSVLRPVFARVIDIPESNLDNDFQREVIQLKTRQLTSLSHRHILEVFGLCEGLSPIAYAIVTPAIPEAELLFTYLRNNIYVERITKLCDIADGLEYLHRYGIIHGDLRCANVLVDNNGVIKLADYGLKFFDPRISQSEVSFAGNSSLFSELCSNVRQQWTAPELLTSSCTARSRASRESDVYSFGMLCMEVFTERLPFNGSSIPKADLVDMITSHHLRPSYPGRVAERRGLSKGVWALMCDCWQHDSCKRPNVLNILSTLSQLSGRQWRGSDLEQ